jgi:hypothetical protein
MPSDNPRFGDPRRQRFPGGQITSESPVTILTDVPEALAAMTSAVRLRATMERRGHARFLGNAPLVGMFVFTQGRWSDLTSAFERAYVQGELTNRGYFDMYTGSEARAFTGASILELLEGPTGSILADYPVKPELLAIEARLSAIEERVERLASGPVSFESRRPAPKGEDESRERSAKDDPESGEILNVKPAVVDVTFIASAVQSFGITHTSAWKIIADQNPGAQFFAIDADPRSFQVSEKGAFDGRANVLLSVPRKLRSGRETTFSITIPTRVFGKLSPDGEIEVSEFKIN